MGCVNLKEWAPWTAAVLVSLVVAVGFVTGPLLAQEEICNHQDDDGDGLVDEGFASVLGERLAEDPDGEAHDNAGLALLAPGDLTGDGTPDLLVGIPYDDVDGNDSGSVMLISGADRSLVWRAHADEPSDGDLIGRSLAWLGDVNGDGTGDFAAGAPLDHVVAGQDGSVSIFSGADGTRLRRCHDPEGTVYDRLGDFLGLSAAGDLTGDGIQELAAGACAADVDGLEQAGRIVIFSPVDCTMVRRLTDPEPTAYAELGRALAAGGDVDGDGTPDLLAGEPGWDQPYADGGAVLVFSGADGSLLSRLTDPEGNVSAMLGRSLAAAGNLDGTGGFEIVAGAPNQLVQGVGEAGAAVLFDSLTETVVGRYAANSPQHREHLATSVAVVEDRDGDGTEEILAGGPYWDGGGLVSRGRALVFSGASGALLRELVWSNAATDDQIGHAVVGLGDLSGDGVPELAVSAHPRDRGKRGANVGTVVLFAEESDCDEDGAGPWGRDCDDQEPAVGPGFVEVCDGLDNDCDGGTDEDEDADGYDACDEEAVCDPADDPNHDRGVHPDGVEICDGRDNDCNGLVDDGPDVDGDSVSWPCDCDDDDASVHPGAEEICDHRANACGPIDEGFPRPTHSRTVEDRKANVGDQFGHALAALDDVDGDGVADLAVGAPPDDTPGWDAGSAVVHSGATLLPLCRAAGIQDFDRMGEALAGLGDVDGDGAGDFASSHPGNRAVTVVSGATCETIARCEDPDTEDIGAERGLARLEDVTGDGVPEIIAGCPGHHANGNWSGRGVVFSVDPEEGSCSWIYRLDDPEVNPGNRLGASAADAGDVDGDGLHDIALGEPADGADDDRAGCVVLFSGADGHFMGRWRDPEPGWRDEFGHDLASLGDVDGDGISDTAVGAPYRATAVHGDGGQVVIVSGYDGSVITRAEDTEPTTAYLGWSIARVPDMDGDGADDVVAGAKLSEPAGQQQAGRLVVFSGADGLVLERFDAEAPQAWSQLGTSVAALADAGGPGISALAGGAPGYDGPTGDDAGRVHVFVRDSDCDGDELAPWMDCDDTDDEIWRVPSETRELSFASDEETISWLEPADPGFSSGTLSYDALKTPDPSDFVGAMSCLESGDDDLKAQDAAVPDAGGGFFYLTRACNRCGSGELGTWGEGDPRHGGECP
jgi:hypothetical protein